MTPMTDRQRTNLAGFVSKIQHDTTNRENTTLNQIATLIAVPETADRSDAEKVLNAVAGLYLRMFADVLLSAVELEQTHFKHVFPAAYAYVDQNFELVEDAV